MQQDTSRDDVKAELIKGYQAIEEQIGHCSAEQAWAMYYVSAGVVREQIAHAVIHHIRKGNKALRAEFPELARADRETPTSG